MNKTCIRIIDVENWSN